MFSALVANRPDDVQVGANPTFVRGVVSGSRRDQILGMRQPVAYGAIDVKANGGPLCAAFGRAAVGMILKVYRPMQRTASRARLRS